MILMTIIVGLGLAEILKCASRLLLSSRRFGVIHAFWMAIVFLHLIEVVVGTWAYRERTDWTFIQILALVIPTAVLYVSASVLNSIPRDASADEAFLRRRRPFGTTSKS